MQRLPSAEAVTQRDAIPSCIVVAEFDVVVNQVQTHFRANKSVTPEVGANATSKVSHEVIAAKVWGTSSEATVQVWGIKPKILAADASYQLSRNGFGKLWSPDRIKGVKDWTIGLEASVQPPTRSPGNVSFNAHAMQ